MLEPLDMVSVPASVMRGFRNIDEKLRLHDDNRRWHRRWSSAMARSGAYEGQRNWPKTGRGRQPGEIRPPSDPVTKTNLARKVLPEKSDCTIPREISSRLVVARR